MSLTPAVLHEDEAKKETAVDRWSKDLIGTQKVPTTSGFNLGVASYHVEQFGEIQVHEDQEALYVISGVGEIRLGDRVYPVRPGLAVYVPPRTPHATRRTGPDPVKVVFAHGPI